MGNISVCLGREGGVGDGSGCGQTASGEVRGLLEGSACWRIPGSEKIAEVDRSLVV